MPAAWIGTIGQLKELFHNNRLIPEINKGFEAVYYRPSEAEVNSWRESLPTLLNVLSNTKYDNLQAILELAMPVGAERADVVLLGGTMADPTAIVIELKQWSHVELDEATQEVDVPTLGKHQHPSLQALNYAGKLHFFNSRADSYDIRAIVLLTNASKRDIEAMSKKPTEDYVRLAPIVNVETIGILTTLIETYLLPCELPAVEAEEFRDAPYRQSNHLFSFLQDHAKDLAAGASLALANTGMGLTAEQENIINRIMSFAENGSSGDFIINGMPGSGKTLLAVSLLLRAAEKKLSCILAIRNNRLQAILRQIFDRAYPGASGMMMFFEPRQGVGIANYQGNVDLLICDEAQRMEQRIMTTVLSKARVCGIFLDESQRLNPPEQGTVGNFSEASATLRKHYEVLQLSASIRIPLSYSAWVETLLAQPSRLEALKLGRMAGGRGYFFKIYNSADELLANLASLRSPLDRVALVASFTESPGNPSSANAPDNLRLGYPLSSGFELYKGTKVRIPWLMSTADYKKYWIGGTSNDLNRVASIYGSQGFESDFVGVIWGRDLLYREGAWVLGDPNVCFDSIDRLVTGKLPNRHWNTDALSLVKNRYRIFLTRGMKGTILSCEDAETSEYLQSLN